MASSVCFRPSSSSWKCRAIRPPPIRNLRLAAARGAPRLARPWLALPLPESPGDVVLGTLVPGIGEERPGGSELDQLAQEEKARVIAHPGRLLHVVGDDHDGVAGLELE